MRTNTPTKQVIIIGSGIAGCSTAYALAKRGIHVTILERHQAIAQEASGNPLAILYPKLNTGVDIRSRLTALGFEHTLKILAESQADHLSYELCGQLQLAYNQREKDKLAQVTANSQQQIVDKDQASVIAGVPVEHGGLHIPQAGWINPQRLCLHLTQSPLIAKVMHSEALTIKQISQHWEVKANQNTQFEADAVVVCNANDLNHFKQSQDIPITPVRGQVNFVNSNTDSEMVQSVLCSNHYISPAINGQHSIGTSYGPNNLNAALSIEDTLCNFAAIQTISPWLYEKMKLYENINLNEANGRVAWRSATKDYLPLAGQLINHQKLHQSPPRYNDAAETLPWFNGFYINAGHGSKGMITAPLCGEMIAAMINHEPLIVHPKMASQLHPSRFALKALGLKKLAQNLYPI